MGLLRVKCECYSPGKTRSRPSFRQSMLDEPEKKNWLKKLMLVHSLEP